MYTVEVEALTPEICSVVAAMTGFHEFSAPGLEAAGCIVFTFSDDIDDGDAHDSMQRNLRAARIHVVRVSRAD